MDSYKKPMEGQELLSLFFFFFGGGGKNLRVVLQSVFGRDFVSPGTAIVSGIKNYSSASMSCCSDGLAHLLPCLDL